MSWVRFSLAVIATSLVLVVAVVAAGGLFVGNALASTGAAFMQHQALGMSGNMAPEWQNLKDIPPAERFSHFKGIQAELTDKDGKPMNVAVVPGVASAVSASSITLQGNDGASHTYALDAQTFTRGKTPAPGQNVVVVTLNGSANARAVFTPDANGWRH